MVTMETIACIHVHQTAWGGDVTSTVATVLAVKEDMKVHDVHKV